VKFKGAPKISKTNTSILMQSFKTVTVPWKTIIEPETKETITILTLFYLK
jgi:hypothetical protein